MNDNFNTDLYQDWKMTAEKEEMISELENRVSKENAKAIQFNVWLGCSPNSYKKVEEN